MKRTLREEGELFVTFAGRLEQLRSEEKQKPAYERREVPTLKELAIAVGIHPVTLTNIANDNTPMVNKDTVRKILDEMWRRGFHLQLIDFIKYVPPENDK